MKSKKNKKILPPNKRDKVTINPPHAFLEAVRKIAVEIAIINETIIPFLNKFDDFSKNKAIEMARLY